ncbi:MAG: transcriptional repressor [Clostridia bacterium]|nr:transcriptional repressor [Clostridia bacterium]
MAASRVIDELKEAGYKLTPQRREIVRILGQATKPITAQEVCTQVQAVFPDTSLDTVYRNLRLLVDLDLVTQIRSGTCHSDCFELVRQHHYHLVCLRCGSITCLPGCPVANWQPTQEELNGFQVIKHSFELHGYCSKCQNQMRAHRGQN